MYSFFVHHLVNRKGRHLLALGNSLGLLGVWQNRLLFQVPDLTRDPIPESLHDLMHATDCSFVSGVRGQFLKTLS
jgi:hypothetical protein